MKQVGEISTGLLQDINLLNVVYQLPTKSGSKPVLVWIRWHLLTLQKRIPSFPMTSGYWKQYPIIP